MLDPLAFHVCQRLGRAVFRGARQFAVVAASQKSLSIDIRDQGQHAPSWACTVRGSASPSVINRKVPSPKATANVCPSAVTAAPTTYASKFQLCALVLGAMAAVPVVMNQIAL